MAKNRFSKERTRNNDVKHHISRNANEHRVVCVEHVQSEEQHADALTKPLGVTNFETDARSLPYSPYRGE